MRAIAQSIRTRVRSMTRRVRKKIGSKTHVDDHNTQASDRGCLRDPLLQIMRDVQKPTRVRRMV